MDSSNVDDTETVLADLELTRGLTIQMTAIGTLGMIVGWAVFSTLYQIATGHVARFQFAPSGIGWWTAALNVLVIVIPGAAFIAPREWLHGLAIRYYGGEARYGVGIAHFLVGAGVGAAVSLSGVGLGSVDARPAIQTTRRWPLDEGQSAAKAKIPRRWRPT